MSITQKTRFLLYGLFGAINVGDELVCFSVADNLRRKIPGCEIGILTLNKKKSISFNNKLDYAEFYEAGAINYKYWVWFFKLVSIVLKHDVIVIGGGGLFQDLYSWRLMSGSLALAALGKLLGRKVFVNGIGIGPIKRGWLKYSTKHILKFVDYITVRDDESFETLQEIDSKIERCSVTADVVPALNLPEIALQSGEGRIAFILRDWAGLNYESAAALIDELAASGKKVDLYCFEPESDSRFYGKILKYCSKVSAENCREVLPDNLECLLEQLGKASVVVSMRLHGCVLSIAMNKPLIPIVYERKVKAFAERAGIVKYLKEVKDIAPTLIDTIKLFSEQNINVSDSEYEKMKQDSMENFRILARELSGPANKLNLANKTSLFFTLFILLFHCFAREVPHLVKAVFCRILKVSD